MSTTALEPVESQQQLQSVDAPTVNLAAMFERLALNPEMPVDKLQVLMDMQRSILAEQSERAFNAAMAATQATIRRVKADAYNNQTKSRYATYAALDRVLRPIYTDNGFGLSFDTADSNAADMVRVQCYVTHAAGHQRTYHIDMPADGKGAKGGDVMTRTHAVGSASQYGMRYLLKMIFNVAIGEDEDDGNAASGKPDTPSPEGYDEWALDIKATADEGLPAFTKAWQDSPTKFRDYLAKRNPEAFNQLKKRAAKAGAA